MIDIQNVSYQSRQNCSKFSTTFCIGTSVVHPLWHSRTDFWSYLKSRQQGSIKAMQICTHSSFINLAKSSPIPPPIQQLGLCHLLLDFALCMSSCCSLSIVVVVAIRHQQFMWKRLQKYLPNMIRSYLILWYDDKTSSKICNHLTDPSYVRFFCPPPMSGFPLNTCDVFLNCEFCKSTSSIHVIIISTKWFLTF